MSQAHEGSFLHTSTNVLDYDTSLISFFPLKLSGEDILGGSTALPSLVYTISPEGHTAVEEASSNLIGTIQPHGCQLFDTKDTLKGEPVYRLSVTSPSTANNFGFNEIANKTLSAGSTHLTLSFWTKLHVLPGTMAGYVRVYYTDLTSQTHNWTYTPNVFSSSTYLEKWTYVKATVALAAGKTPDYLSHVYVSKDSAVEGIMDIARIQLEEKSFPTEYAKTSRAAGLLGYSVPIDPLNAWTLFGETKRNTAFDWQALFKFGNYNTVNESEFQIWLNHTGEVKTYSFDNQVSRSTLLFTPNVGELENWFNWAVSWDSALQQYNIYFWTRDRVYYQNYPLTHANPISPILGLGCHPSSGERILNGNMKNILLFNRALSDKEIKCLYKNKESLSVGSKEVVL